MIFKGQYEEHADLMKEKKITPFSGGDKDYDLWLLLNRARYAVYRARELELLRYDLTPEQSQILFVIHGLKENATPAAIARETFLKSHTISAIVSRMEQKGLVKKTQDLDRKNQVRVSMTEKGQEAYQLSSRRGPIHRVMSALSQDQRDQLVPVLDKILFEANKEPGLNRHPLPTSD
jgi:DNA-binding MarR family transcriptional regulator